MHNAPVMRDERAFGDLVARVDRERALFAEVEEECRDVPRVELARVQCHAAGEVGLAVDRDAVACDDLAWHGELAVAAHFCREVDDDRTRSHPPDRLRRDEDRRATTRYE